MKFRR